MANFYHIYSNGTKSDLLFPTDDEKIFAVNTLAICSLASKIKVIVFIINETHFHLISHGEDTNIENYVLHIKIRISRFLICKQKNKTAFGAGFQIATDKIQDREECLRKIIYVYRNCLDFFKGTPWNYPWGVGNAYFNPGLPSREEQPIGNLGICEQRARFGVREKLPPHWRYDEKGMIVPASFIDVELAEQLFGSVRAFLAFLFVRKEDEAAMKQRIFYRQIEMRSIENLRALATEYTTKLFRKNIRSCSYREKIQIAGLMIKDNVAVKSASLMKAVYLNCDDLSLL